MRSVASFIFIYAIVIGFLPFVLYAGAITLGKLFGVADILGISEKCSNLGDGDYLGYRRWYLRCFLVGLKL